MRAKGVWLQGLDLDSCVQDGSLVFLDGLNSQLFSLLDGSGQLSSSELVGNFERRFHAAIDQTRRTFNGDRARIILIMDQMDLLLAILSDTLTAAGLSKMLLRLRQRVHFSIITVACDDPLLISQNTGLEKQHAAFAMAISHEADRIISVRELDSGAAADVSGIVRVTCGGVAGVREPGDEYIYAINADGKIKALEREKEL